MADSLSSGSITNSSGQCFGYRSRINIHYRIFDFKKLKNCMKKYTKRMSSHVD